MMFTAPDVAVWIYAVIIFFAVRAVVRTIFISVGGRPRVTARPPPR
jgi:hypothetical protein